MRAINAQPPPSPHSILRNELSRAIIVPMLDPQNAEGKEKQ
jgi:hypothetical protein